MSNSPRRIWATASFVAPAFLLVPSILGATGAGTGSGRVRFDDSIQGIPLAAEVSQPHRIREDLTALELAESRDFVISLRMRGLGELQARIHSGRSAARSEMEAKYLPAKAEYDRVASWLVSQGFTLTLEDPNHINLFVRGTIARISAVLGMTFARVATGDGEFTSAVTAPTLPQDLAASVLGIDGLQPHLLMRTPKARPQAATSADGCFTPADVAAAYGIPAGMTGSGQTIAIIMGAAPSESDLDNFWQVCGFNGTRTPSVRVPVLGGPTSASQAQDAIEVTLDAEWAIGMAPGAKLRIYEVPYLSTANVLAACTQILADAANDPSIRVVSYSGAGLESGYSVSSLTADSQTFAQLAAAGITFLTCSGDGGSNPNPPSQFNGYNSSNPLGVEYPASDPNLTSVGGTTLAFDSTWTATTETAWAAGSLATGGGVSSVFPRPSWQAGSGLPSGNGRCVPDIAAVASANSPVNLNGGALVIVHGQGSGQVGTSLSAPVWAGIVATINQARSSLGLKPLGLLGPWIYPLIGTNAFRDITAGGNGTYSAGPGYDLCTGVGAPNVANLIAQIDQEITYSALPASPVDAGSSVALSAVAQLPGTYQWQLNGADIAGAIGSSYVISNVKPANAGAYSVVVTTALGSVSQAIGSLNVISGPAIAVQPVSQTVSDGSTVVLAVAAAGSSSPSSGGARSALAVSAPVYQWQLNGTSIAGATNPRLVIAGTSAANAGTYTCFVSSSGATTVSDAATVSVASTTNIGRLVNFSTLAPVAANQVLTVGFVTGGAGTSGTQNLLVRAMGPALTALGVSGALADPALTVFSGSTATHSNDNWGVTAANQAAVLAADSAVFAYPLTDPKSLDSAVVTSLASGGYTAQISGNGGASGTVLTEVYDNTPSGSFTPAMPRLVNISCHTQVGATGSLTAGFVIGGTTSRTVLIRACGPALAAYGLAGVMPDPQLALHEPMNGNDTIMASNSGWGGDPQITAVGNAVFAFPLNDPSSHDAVILTTLAPGSYTTVASSISGTAGVVMIEVYEVP